jgi:hypothetical protein
VLAIDAQLQKLQMEIAGMEKQFTDQDRKSLNK